MSNKRSVYFRGSGNFGGISASVLKIIAITAMVLDHGSVLFIGPSVPTVYRVIGRIAFPIFAYMISEGARYSLNLRKYALRLFAFALISEVPFDMAFGDNIIDFKNSNVYFTLLLGLCSIALIQRLREKKLEFLGIFSTILLATVALLLNTDYGFMGVIVITLYYLMGERYGASRVILFVMIALMTCFSIYMKDFSIMFAFRDSQLFAALSAVPLCLYNGKKGFRMNKYVFYVFYPVHIALLTFIARF